MVFNLRVRSPFEETEKIIFTNGCFDIIHRAHIELLRYCKSMGKVIVGVNSDASVRRLKGPNRPINTQEDRLFVLSSCKYVDEVIIFEEETPQELIKRIMPDVIVKGGDYSAADVVGAEIAEVKIFKYKTNYSTTLILSKLTLGSLSNENINSFFEKDLD